MSMTRRMFAKLIGAAPAVAPLVPSTAFEMPDALSLGPLSTNPGWVDDNGLKASKPYDPVKHLARRVKYILDPQQRERRWRNTYTSHELHPDLAALKSTSLSWRMAVQRRKIFEKWERDEMWEIERLQWGWWKEEDD